MKNDNISHDVCYEFFKIKMLHTTFYDENIIMFESTFTWGPR